jgi:alpha-tubulin suppressor-like RCC1 family protein
MAIQQVFFMGFGASGGYALFTAGFANFGQTGQGNTTTLSVLTQVGTSTGWTSAALTTKASSSLAAIKDGKLYTCGQNASGECGHGDTTARSVLTQVGSVDTWSEVAAGGKCFIATREDGTAWACGDNTSAQLGQGDTVAVSSFVQMGVATVWSKPRAANYTSGFLSSAGKIYAVGANWGTGNVATSVLTQVGAATNWVEFDFGDQGVGGFINSSNELWSCGRGYQGGHALGNTTNTSALTQITGTDFSRVAHGNATIRVVKTDGTAWSAGWSHIGQGGRGTTTSVSSLTQIGAATDWQVPTHSDHYNGGFTKAAGKIYAMGNGLAYGHLHGDGTKVNISSPVQTGSLDGWVSTALNRGTVVMIR